jgi:hypothetical protein
VTNSKGADQPQEGLFAMEEWRVSAEPVLMALKPEF